MKKSILLAIVLVLGLYSSVTSGQAPIPKGTVIQYEHGVGGETRINMEKNHPQKRMIFFTIQIFSTANFLNVDV